MSAGELVGEPVLKKETLEFLLEFSKTAPELEVKCLVMLANMMGDISDLQVDEAIAAGCKQPSEFVERIMGLGS